MLSTGLGGFVALYQLAVYNDKKSSCPYVRTGPPPPAPLPQPKRTRSQRAAARAGCRLPTRGASHAAHTVWYSAGMASPGRIRGWFEGSSTQVQHSLSAHGWRSGGRAEEAGCAPRVPSAVHARCQYHPCALGVYRCLLPTALVPLLSRAPTLTFADY
jgi:hypothetical protein